MSYEFEMPYISELSENSYKWLGGRGTKPHIKRWMLQLAQKIVKAEVPKAKQYIVGVRGYFRDGRRPDISNLFKVTLDAAEDGLGVNDKHFIAKDDGYELGHLYQHLKITIEVI